MAIVTLDGYIAAPKQRIAWTKTTTRVTVANAWFSLFDVAGDPGAGVLAGTSLAAGVVPTDVVAGYPNINAFVGANKGYLGQLAFGNTVACRVALFDRLWVGGAYAFNANQALAAQPSFASRVPGGNDYCGLEIWAETVTAATGNQTWTVTYTDQNGNAGASTGASGIGAAPTVGRCWQLPFAAGDCGVQKIENVLGGTGTAGTANIMILRPLWAGRVIAANAGDVHDMIRVGLPELWADSALYAMVCADSTSSGLPDLTFQVVNG